MVKSLSYMHKGLSSIARHTYTYIQYIHAYIHVGKEKGLASFHHKGSSE